MRQSPIPSDPEEARLRAAWYATRDSGDSVAHASAHDALSAYLWRRVEADVAEDRRRHPRAKRNQPTAQGPSGDRYLP